MNILWSILSAVINAISNFLILHNGLNQQEAYQISIELILAFSLTFVFMVASMAPVSRKILAFLIAVIWVLILYAIW